VLAFNDATFHDNEDASPAYNPGSKKKGHQRRNWSRGTWCPLDKLPYDSTAKSSTTLIPRKQGGLFSAHLENELIPATAEEEEAAGGEGHTEQVELRSVSPEAFEFNEDRTTRLLPKSGFHSKASGGAKPSEIRTNTQQQ
jgi:hypothetical protein